MDAAIVAEELGRVVFSGPFLSSCVAAFAIAEAGSDQQRMAYLPGLASGEILAAWCIAGGAGDARADGITARRSANGFILEGEATLVEDASVADLLLVSATEGDKLLQFLVPKKYADFTITPLEPLDLGRRLANVGFNGVEVSTGMQLGEPGNFADTGSQVSRQYHLALALQCAETVGVIDRALEFTLEWVKTRYAFGRPIGSYQALKHRLADHAAQLEGAKAAAAHAARAVQEQAPDAAIAVSVAKSHCGRFASEILRDCVQLHGGIGLTWEHDLHFYVRRGVSNEMLWGSPEVHHERLCRLAGL